MENKIEEGNIKDAIDTIPVEKLDRISEQMKKCICKIQGKQTGTGFFCKISYKNNLIPVLITNYHIIDDDFIRNNKRIVISINNSNKILDINEKSKIYSSNRDKFDIMIIKLKEGEINNFLEIDQEIFMNGSEFFYKGSSIYVLHYPNGDKPSVSFGYGFEKVDNNDFRHKCNTNFCSSGGPIFNLSNNKVIGIHKSFIKNPNEEKKFNIGTFLKFPLNEINQNKINEKTTIIRPNKNEINTSKSINFPNHMGSQVINSGIMNNYNQQQILFNDPFNTLNIMNPGSSQLFQPGYIQIKNNNEIQPNNNETITIFFIRENEINSGKRNIGIFCKTNEKVADAIEKFRLKTNDRRSQRFMFNAKNLNNIDKLNSTLLEAGLIYGSRIFVN